MSKESNDSNEYKADKTPFELMELMLLSNIFNALFLYSYLHTPLEANKVSCKKWQLVSASCDEGDGLIFLDRHS
jgi:hypothetical protein